MITIQLYPLADSRQQRIAIDKFTDRDFIKSVDSWLMELHTTKRGKIPWRFNIRKNKGKLSVTFVRYEDALAFRLKFGL